uniref:Uncharacterized protein n=1 Tax=Anopheles arabiensis TaxID=7173 RepID=A0A182IGI5_ANOAR
MVWGELLLHITKSRVRCASFDSSCAKGGCFAFCVLVDAALLPSINVQPACAHQPWQEENEHERRAAGVVVYC